METNDRKLPITDILARLEKWREIAASRTDLEHSYALGFNDAIDCIKHDLESNENGM